MIIFVHLNNDFSGSPKVLRDVIKVASDLNISYKIYVSDSSQFGFLSGISNNLCDYWYRKFKKNKVLTFLSLCVSQIHLFVKLLLDKDITPSSIIYVNTLLPFGANFYALITRRKLICHIHEISLSPYMFYRSLTAINYWTSDCNLFVSEEHFRLAKLTRTRSFVLPNCLDNEMLLKSQINACNYRVGEEFVVLMICGAARYKGIPEFVAVARLIEPLDLNISFKLVLNCQPNQIPSHVKYEKIPSNMVINSVSDDVSSYYRSSSLLINLSRVDMWIETFGLTILEGMAFGLPVIAPPVGGPVDFVTDSVDGFLVDSRDVQKVCDSIIGLYADPDQYCKMSVSAKRTAEQYSFEKFRARIAPLIEAWNKSEFIR